MKKSVKYILFILAFAVFIGLIAMKLISNKNEVAAKIYKKDINASAIVTVVKMLPQTIQFNTNYLGTFQPYKEVVISSELQGKVIQVGINEGSKLSQGALIAMLDTDITKARLIAAEAQLSDSKINLTRYTNALQEGQAVTQSQVDAAKLKVKISESDVIQLRKQLSQSRISTPFSGVITEKKVELGAVISPGTPLATLTDISSLKLEVSVPETEITNFYEGQDLKIHSDVYPDEIYNGKVHYISDKSDASHQYSIKILVQNNSQKLKAGMYGSITTSTQLGSTGLAIPRTALLGSSKEPQVFVVRNNKAYLTNIRTGKSNDTSIEITNGLREGDLVVTSGQVNLATGTQVSISK